MTGRVQPRAEYRDLRAYDHESVRVDLELADNTSVYGAPPSARAHLAAAAAQDVSQYPTTYSAALRRALADYLGVAADQIMVGAGSDEILSCTFRALGQPGDTLAHMHPTFVMTRVFAVTNSLRATAVPLTPSFDADADALLAHRAAITYLCTPNNPTGTLVERPTLDRVIAEARGVVLVDEAYAEFAGTNLAAAAPTHDGVLVLRTLSKAFGLAGLRVGFAVGARQLIAELEKARGPYTVSAVSEAVALAAVRDDVAWVRDRAAEVVETRDWMVRELQARGAAPLPSAANFVLLPVPDARAAGAHLLRKGIRVREFVDLPAIGDALRITIGRGDDMIRVLRALEEPVS
jgi:histidinol-phosphate aminotransferase